MNWLTLSILTLLFWGLWGFFLKLSGLTMGTKSVMVYEVLGALIVAIYILFSMNFKLETNIRGIAFAVLSGLAVAVGTLLFVYALAKGKPSAVLAITALYPAVAILLSIIFLKEPISPRHVMGVVLALSACYFLAV